LLGKRSEHCLLFSILSIPKKVNVSKKKYKEKKNIYKKYINQGKKGLEFNKKVARLWLVK
jgi:hypothetical protein